MNNDVLFELEEQPHTAVQKKNFEIAHQLQKKIDEIKQLENILTTKEEKKTKWEAICNTSMDIFREGINQIDEEYKLIFAKAETVLLNIAENAAKEGSYMVEISLHYEYNKKDINNNNNKICFTNFNTSISYMYLPNLENLQNFPRSHNMDGQISCHKKETVFYESWKFDISQKEYWKKSDYSNQQKNKLDIPFDFQLALMEIVCNPIVINVFCNRLKNIFKKSVNDCINVTQCGITIRLIKKDFLISSGFKELI